MNKAEFVEVIRLVVQEGSVDDTRSVLSRPPGRKSVPELAALSAWFKHLSSEDRQNVLRVAQLTSGYAVFGFLCVLDGVRAIENGPNKGTLELRYRRGAVDVHLNEDEGSALHELL
jgi:hypothetical protein